MATNEELETRIDALYHLLTCQGEELGELWTELAKLKAGIQ